MKTLEILINHVVNPIRSTIKQQKILNPFKFNKIFLNVDQIMLVNKRFLNQLEQQPDKFGFICQCYVNKKQIKKKKKRLTDFELDEAIRMLL